MTEQGEAIAQERAIARLNADGVYGDSGSLGAITPNLQWETKVAYVPTPTGRVDLLTYDRSNPAGPVSIVEMKGTWDGGADRAAQEVTDYVNANHGLFGARDVEPYDFNASPFPIDTFSIDRCASADPHINNYTTHTEPGTPGVLVVDRTRASCASQNQPVPSPHVNLNGIDVYIGVDNNGNGNDDLFDSLVSWAQAHGRDCCTNW